MLGYNLASHGLLRLQVQVWKVFGSTNTAEQLLESASVDVTHCIGNDLAAHDVRILVWCAGVDMPLKSCASWGISVQQLLEFQDVASRRRGGTVRLSLSSFTGIAAVKQRLSFATKRLADVKASIYALCPLLSSLRLAKTGARRCCSRGHCVLMHRGAVAWLAVQSGCFPNPSTPCCTKHPQMRSHSRPGCPQASVWDLSKPPVKLP